MVPSARAGRLAAARSVGLRYTSGDLPLRAVGRGNGRTGRFLTPGRDGPFAKLGEGEAPPSPCASAAAQQVSAGPLVSEYGPCLRECVGSPLRARARFPSRDLRRNARSSTSAENEECGPANSGRTPRLPGGGRVSQPAWGRGRVVPRQAGGGARQEPRLPGGPRGARGVCRCRAGVFASHGVGRAETLECGGLDTAFHSRGAGGSECGLQAAAGSRRGGRTLA